jgi:hypothetical protein
LINPNPKDELFLKEVEALFTNRDEIFFKMRLCNKYKK